MKILTLPSVCMSLLLAFPAIANAEVDGDILSLIGVLDNGLCAYADGDMDLTNGCDLEFDGWFGSSTDLFRNGGKKRKDKGCVPMPLFPAEDSGCNVTQSKAEWRHDSLRATLESAYRGFVKGKFNAANRKICYFVDHVNGMDAERKIDVEGVSTLVPAAEQIARDIGTDCLDLET